MKPSQYNSSRGRGHVKLVGCSTVAEIRTQRDLAIAEIESNNVEFDKNETPMDLNLTKIKPNGV
jgi:hypothetical protein